MRIQSTVAEATKYSTDALEAFYTAVDNGQARLALLILVDIIEVFADKLDEFEELKASLVVNVEKENVKEEKHVEKVLTHKQEEITPPEAEVKTKPKAKEQSSDQ